MPIDGLRYHSNSDLRHLVARLAFIAVFVSGAVIAMVMLAQLQQSAYQQARAGREAIAASVAQTLAAQFARAVRVGVPLDQIPGVPDYLQRTLEHTPHLASLALQQADGKPLHSAQRQTPQQVIQVPVIVQGQTVAQIAAGTQAVASLDFAKTYVLTALSVLLLALLAAVLAFYGPGTRWQRRHKQLLAGLTQEQIVPVRDRLSNDALEQALQTLAQAQQQQMDAQLALNDYARELLAVDFDQRMRARIAAVVALPQLQAKPEESAGH